MDIWLDNSPFVHGTAPERYPTVTDFQVERHPGPGVFGSQMKWTSRSLGFLTGFPWWDHLEQAGTALDEMAEVGRWSRADPYFDADQNWWFEIWAADGFVYVHSGSDARELVWYRVPLGDFTAAITKFRDAIRHPKVDT